MLNSRVEPVVTPIYMHKYFIYVVILVFFMVIGFFFFMDKTDVVSKKQKNGK